jgi:DNA gyrase subunit A
LKKGEPSQVVLNNLYKMTPMQSSFGIILLAIVGNQPKVLNLREALLHFIEHRRNVVRRRTVFELGKAEARAHILEGLKRALDMLDEVISLIRGSKEPAVAKEGLMTTFQFSAEQAQAILDMRLQRLTGLERDKIVAEYEEILKLIARLKEILANEKVLDGVVVEELREVQKSYGDDRRTQILEEEAEISREDLIAEEDVVITITHSGYIKRTATSLYRPQARGGKGRIGMTTRSEDFIHHVYVASTHSYLLVFTNRGKVYWLKVYKIPDVGTAGKGKAIVNLVNIDKNETIADIIPVKDFETGENVIMATRNGIVKKSALSEYANPRSSGIIAITIPEDDELIGCDLTDGSYDVLLATRLGKAIRFSEKDARTMGRTARGVIGIRMSREDRIVSMSAFKGSGQFLTVTENGYGKRTDVDGYPRQRRGGSGVINVKVSAKNGKVINTCHVLDDDSCMLITGNGKLIQLYVNDIRNTQSRASVGVKCIDLGNEDKVAGVTVVESEEEKSTAPSEES